MKTKLKIISLLSCLFISAQGICENYDVVILNGRAMDPETGLDAIRNIGITKDTIKTITTDSITGDKIIDAKGYVVSPGFIDAHYHWARTMGYKLGLRDGITTSMDLEFGALGTKIDEWYKIRENKTQVNYGTSVSHELARSLVLDGAEAIDAPSAYKTRTAGKNWAEMVPNDEQSKAIKAVIRQGLEAGGIGVGSTLGYMPGANAIEMYDIQKMAGEFGRQVSVHLRNTPGTASSEINGAQEILANAAALNSPASINHFNNPGWESIYELISKLRSKGHNVWGEIYPYAAGSTTINAVFLRPEIWVEKLGRRYEDTMFNPKTNAFLTQESYEKTLQENPATVIVLYKMPETEIPKWVSLPDVTMGSDGMCDPPGENAWDEPYETLPNMHPRGAGAHAKSLRLSREFDIPLIQVLGQLSFNTAKYLGDMGLKSMQQRGRLQEGMKADIVIFDPETVKDNATYEKGTLPSTGIDWVLVNGQITVENQLVKSNVFAGQAIRFD